MPNVVIEVKPGQPLGQISLNRLGRSNRKLVEEIRSLNSSIRKTGLLRTDSLSGRGLCGREGRVRVGPGEYGVQYGRTPARAPLRVSSSKS
jgi:hypothetical protein